MLFRRTIPVAAAAAGLTLLLGAAPATAMSVPSYDPVGVYVLTVTPDDGTTAEPLAASTLLCGPDGGAHAAAAAACDQLRRVQGRAERIPEDPGPCTREYAPVRVSAVGIWRGQRREYARTFPNRCEAVRATGGILFAF
ncbi:SSI family serine proteinase inhibitor [Nonomuraea indica]|uniref:SSI family serine proteinase inhibitor n=1 Tax=Nonomuraea indica TaxID=1581193 RepID=A0ABW8A133_9ACTN|nr:SSI family serine proteinase inhibitor [Nonomuraea indica]